MHRRVLIYGVGKSGGLFAYLFLKKLDYVYLYDINYDRALKLFNDLNTIHKHHASLLVEERTSINFDIVIVASSNVDVSVVRWLSRNAKMVYIYSNLNEDEFKELEKISNVYLCGALVNNRREKWFFGEVKLVGFHWREIPEERREKLREIVNTKILPFQYAAVDSAIEEIEKRWGVLNAKRY